MSQTSRTFGDMTTSFGYTIAYVDDVAATLEFFVDGFGMAQRFITPEGDYGELNTGTTTLAFAATALAAANLASGGGFSPLDADTRPTGVSITLLTDDVPASLDAALAAGGTRYVAPMQKPWGQTVAYMRDPNGLLIEIATPMTPMTPGAPETPDANRSRRP